MRANAWGAAFILAVIVHITGLAFVGQGLLGEIALEPKTEYLEVELAAAPLAKGQNQIKPAPAPAASQSSRTINNGVSAATAPVAPSFTAVEDRNVVAPLTTSGIAGDPVTEIGGSGSGTAAGVEAGTGGTGNTGVDSRPASAGPLEEHEVDRRPYAVYAPPPEYLSEARFNKWQGRVIIRVLVEASGRVADTRVAQSSGYDELDQAAAEVLYRWRFNPAERGGRAVTAWVRVPVSFKLTR